MRRTLSSSASDLPRVTIALVAGQALCFGLAVLEIMPLKRLILVPALVLKGELWRIITWPFVPLHLHPLWVPFAWYVLLIIGTALEQTWGTARYTRFLLNGYITTLALATLFTPHSYIPNTYLLGSLFLAFALLNPDHTIYLFFVFPIKVKWVGALTAVGYILECWVGATAVRLVIVAAGANLLLHFRQELYARFKSARRHKTMENQRAAHATEPFHRCTICGITNHTHPDMDFRYCSRCEGEHGYCSEHIQNHPHTH